MTKKTLAASLAILTFLVCTSSALASSGYAIDDVNVRAGAGTGYDVIGSLSAGEAVEIIKCGGGWCLTEEGYVAASYLAIGGTASEDEDEDDDRVSHIDEDGEFDDDPLGLTDDVPESLKSDD